jgi:hypothetical protein
MRRYPQHTLNDVMEMTRQDIKTLLDAPVDDDQISFSSMAEYNQWRMKMKS